jgi:hypothetical protein
MNFIQNEQLKKKQFMTVIWNFLQFKKQVIHLSNYSKKNIEFHQEDIKNLLLVFLQPGIFVVWRVCKIFP